MLLDDGEEEADEELYELQVATGILVVGAEASRLLRIEQRHENRNYLCRPQLPPNPRHGTALQSLFRSRDDRAFITTMGFDVSTFELIVTSGFGYLWILQPIPRNDTTSAGNTRPGARSLDAWGALGLVLHCLNSTMREISLQQIFGLIPTTLLDCEQVLPVMMGLVFCSELYAIWTTFTVLDLVGWDKRCVSS